MKKILTMFVIICLVVVSIDIAIAAGPVATITITKIKYTLNGVSSGEILLETPVPIVLYADGSAKAPVKLYDFPNTLEGTITSVDMYVAENTSDGGTGWWTVITSQDLAKTAISVTNSTQEIYVGAIIQQGPPTVVNPGTR